MERNKASTNMRELVLEVGGPVQGSENRKSWFARIARQTGLSRRSVSAAFYGELRGKIHTAGVEAKLRAVLDRQERAASDDIAKLKSRLEALERRFASTDPDFGEPHVVAHREILRVVGGKDGS